MPERKTVHWDSSERYKVAAEALKISARDPKLTLRSIVSRAQVVLPKGRQRPIDKTQDEKLAAWLMPLWDEMTTKQKSQAKAAQGVAQLFAPAVDAVTQAFIGPVMPSYRIPGPDTAPAEPQAPAEPVDEPQQDARPSSSEAASNDRKMSVHWKDEDKRKVAAKAHALMQGFPDMKRLEAVRKAMASELPADRQRDIQTWSMVSAWADPMIEQLEIDARMLQLEQKRAREATEEARRADDARIEAERLRAEDAARVRALEMQASTALQIEKLSFEDLIRAFAAKLARETINAIGAEFEKQMAGKISDAIANGTSTRETTPGDDERLIVPPKSRLPLVGVVGLLNQQAEDVRKAFLGTIEFVFVKSQQEGGNNGGGHAMLDKCARCDVVIAMTDFMGHDVDASAKRLNVPYKRLTGSASSLKRFLTSWINGEVALKAA